MGGARDFDSTTSDYLSGPTAVSTVTGNLSMYAWVYPDTTSPTSHAFIICDISPQTGGSNPTNFSWSVGEYANNNNILELSVNDGSFTTVGGSGDIGTGAWTHVGITYDGTNVRFYINGVLDASPAMSVTLPTGASQFPRIGLRRTGSDNTFDGRIAYFGYHTEVLSAEDMKWAMRHGFIQGHSCEFTCHIGLTDVDFSPNTHTVTVNGTTLADGPPVINVFGMGGSILSLEGPTVITSSDAFTIGLNEIAIVLSLVNVTDTFSTGLLNASQVINSLLSVSDTFSITLVEVGDINDRHHERIFDVTLVVSGNVYTLTLVVSGNATTVTQVVSGNAVSPTLVVSGNEQSDTLVVSGNEVTKTLVV